MPKPIVAVVGRPNTGKSTLFNYLAGKKISIVEDIPGVTRDRIYADCEWLDRKFMLIDTGGIEPVSDDIIKVQMRRQAELAMDMADVILFIVDFKTGVTSSDIEVANMLRRTKKPVMLVCNKVDHVGKVPEAIYDFYTLGIGEPIPISSTNRLGIGDLLDKVYEHFPQKDEFEDNDEVTKVAIIGKPNSGKSSLVNKIVGEERTIVSDIAGTTRDAIDTYFENNKGKYIFIDTAGIRKKNKIYDDLERYSILRALAAIDRADVCIIMVDAIEGVTEQDTKIAGYAHNAGKGVIVVVNKWDIYEKETGVLEKYAKKLKDDFAFMQYAPSLFISALTGQRVEKIFDMINKVKQENEKRITTGMINEMLSEAVAMVQPPSDKGRRLKIYYMTQVSSKPPTFVVFVNNKKLMHYSYERYLENQLRKHFGFEGTTINIITREKAEKEVER